MENVNVFPMIYSHRVSKAGEVAIVICITLDNKPVHYEPLHKKVKLADWDPEKKCSKSNKMLNAFITKEVSELQTKFTQAQIMNQRLTKSRIKKIIAGDNAGDRDFLKYCEDRIPERYPKPEQGETRRTYRSEVSKLRMFNPEVYFGDLDAHFMSRYKAWMINEKKNADNTVWKSLKFLNTMINDAMPAGLIKENPFDIFDRGKYIQGRRDYLELEDCDKIYKLLQTEIPDRLRIVGMYYLFMCYTGFRFNDAVRFFNYESDVIDDERIRMGTQKFGTDVTILIHTRLRPVVNFVRDHPLKISNRDFNSYTKVLATMASIPVTITAHVGRHTFGATLAELNVPIEKAQMLLGHKEKRSTEIYYHIKNRSLDIEMEKWNLR